MYIAKPVLYVVNDADTNFKKGVSFVRIVIQKQRATTTKMASEWQTISLKIGLGGKRNWWEWLCVSLLQGQISYAIMHLFPNRRRSSSSGSSNLALMSISHIATYRVWRYNKTQNKISHITSFQIKKKKQHAKDVCNLGIKNIIIISGSNIDNDVSFCLLQVIQRQRRRDTKRAGILWLTSKIWCSPNHVSQCALQNGKKNDGIINK